MSDETPPLAGAQGLPLLSVDPVTRAAAGRILRDGHCQCLAHKTKSGNPQVPTLHVEAQDTALPGWQNVCRLVAEAATAGATVMGPSAVILAKDWAGVVTLPESIGALTGLAELRLYGSHLRRLPPEIGNLAALENLDVYTSYSLHWLPYEVTRCRRLRDTRMSTRALYGNRKTRLPFPRLAGAVDILTPKACSVCDQPFGTRPPRLYWTTQRIGTDTVPLLIHSCSDACTEAVPDAPAGYFPRPHKGGGGVGMPEPGYP